MNNFVLFLSYLVRLFGDQTVFVAARGRHPMGDDFVAVMIEGYLFGFTILKGYGAIHLYGYDDAYIGNGSNWMRFYELTKDILEYPTWAINYYDEYAAILSSDLPLGKKQEKMAEFREKNSLDLKLPSCADPNKLLQQE